MPGPHVVYAGDPELSTVAERLIDLYGTAVNAGAGDRASEADIVHGIVDLLVTAGLVDRSGISLEADRNDIRTGDLIIEVKRRIGWGIEPKPSHVEQLDGYLNRARESGESRLGILTDGRHWVLRQAGAGEVRTNPPYAFVLQDSSGAIDLVTWLGAETQALPLNNQKPAPDAIAAAFGISLSAETFLGDLGRLYRAHRDDPTVTVKRDLWRDLLAAALGEVISDEADLDRLFVRHTYLSMIVTLGVQAAFGIDIVAVAARRPAELVDGAVFIDEVGVRGVVESDFFGWPAETEIGCGWIAGLVSRVAGFDWGDADYDVARVLYQAVIDADDRRRLGEYYTPDWLATAIVTEVVDDSLDQRVLDPACGSGSFLRAAITAYIDRAEAAGWDANQTLSGLREAVTGIDVHPVAVHLARATWVLAARSVITAADDVGSLTVPVYLGDSLQLLAGTGSLLELDNVRIEIKPNQVDGRHRFLLFPKGLVARGDWFDELMLKAATDIAAGLDPTVTLNDAQIPQGDERDTLETTLRTLAELHAEGRNHIWAYYTRNLVRPVWLSTDEGRVDRMVGNPPWLTYNRAEATVRDELERLSKAVYRIWAGGKYAPHQDMAGLFYTRSMDLYLRVGGKAAMVLPHSALAAGQYEKWRTGDWGRSTGADLGTESWDLERIEPNTFFPITASVVFAARTAPGEFRRLSPTAKRWLGPEGGPNPTEQVTLATSGNHASPYGQRAKQGATIVPRVLFFVNVAKSGISLDKGAVKVSPMRSSNEKSPWRTLNPPELSGSIEKVHVRRVHRGDTVAPFVMLEPHRAVLPLRRGDTAAPWPGPEGIAIAGVDPAGLERRMRTRWRNMSSLWDDNKKPHNKLTLIGSLDYRRKLSGQMDGHPIRLVYASSGRPTAAALINSDTFIDYTLFWLPCKTLAEAFYLAAVINSKTLYEAVKPLMPTGQFGARHLQKHLWRLPISTYDPDDPTHQALAAAGATAADQATEVLTTERRAHAATDKPMTVTVARRVLRAWLDSSEVGRTIETHAETLLAGFGSDW